MKKNSARETRNEVMHKFTRNCYVVTPVYGRINSFSWFSLFFVCWIVKTFRLKMLIAESNSQLWIYYASIISGSLPPHSNLYIHTFITGGRNTQSANERASYWSMNLKLKLITDMSTGSKSHPRFEIINLNSSKKNIKKKIDPTMIVIIGYLYF